MTDKIKDSLEKYPAFLSSEHLVDLGIYQNTDSAYHARTNGHSPQWIKLRHKIIYPKFAVAEFLEKRMNKEDSCLFSSDKLTMKES